jgi:hypothetical protein
MQFNSNYCSNAIINQEELMDQEELLVSNMQKFYLKEFTEDVLQLTTEYKYLEQQKSFLNIIEDSSKEIIMFLPCAEENIALLKQNVDQNNFD